MRGEGAPGWGAGRAGRDARSKCNDFFSSVGETGSELRASERGSLPGRMRLFGWSKTVGLRAGAVGLRGTCPGRGQKLQASWAGAQGARQGTPGRTGVGWE